ncbi:hypothetical protein KKA33_03295 [Patescibacteria group bacterium]|nr:hypothetical protein [Patescibacteria group bacterium]
MPEKALLELAKLNRDVLKEIINPSEEVQFTAVERNGNAIRYIENPSRAVQLVAIRQNPDVLRHIENPVAEAVALAGELMDKAS